jgi:hypothetical protein
MLSLYFANLSLAVRWAHLEERSEASICGQRRPPDDESEASSSTMHDRSSGGVSLPQLLPSVRSLFQPFEFA